MSFEFKTMVKAFSLISKKKRRYKADGYNLDLDDSSKTSRRIKVNNLCPERFLHSSRCKAAELCQHATIKLRMETPKRTNHREASKSKLVCDWLTKLREVLLISH